jgi:hypothetical protein
MNTTTTNTEIIPTRVASDHYQTPSFTEADKIYDQNFDYDLKRWLCNCADATYRKNMNCKHAILLRAFIKREKAQAGTQHSSSVELVQTLARISTLEGTVWNLDHALSIKEDQTNILLGRLTGREYQIDKQQKQLNLQRELIGNLQSDVCRLNERTINQDVQIQQLTSALAEQAQLIDKLTEQISQQKTEQVVRIIVEQPAAKERKPKAEAAPVPQPAKRGRKPNPNKVEAIKVDGVFTKCLVGGEFEVGIDNFNPVSCTCERHQKEGVYCVHMQRVDSEFA